MIWKKTNSNKRLVAQDAFDREDSAKRSIFIFEETKARFDYRGSSFFAMDSD